MLRSRSVGMKTINNNNTVPCTCRMNNSSLHWGSLMSETSKLLASMQVFGMYMGKGNDQLKAQQTCNNQPTNKRMRYTDDSNLRDIPFLWRTAFFTWLPGADNWTIRGAGGGGGVVVYDTHAGDMFFFFYGSCHDGFAPREKNCGKSQDVLFIDHAYRVKYTAYFVYILWRLFRQKKNSRSRGCCVFVFLKYIVYTSTFRSQWRWYCMTTSHRLLLLYLAVCISFL